MRPLVFLLVATATKLAAAEPTALATDAALTTSTPTEDGTVVVTPPPGPHPAHTTMSLAEAPPPNEAHGMVREGESENTALIWIPRALLFIPRVVIWTVAQPIRGGVYVYEKYDLGGRFTDATFTDDRKFGIYPVAGYDSNFGATFGARLLYKDILGKKERLKLRADWGGQFQYGIGANLRTGDRFGPISFGIDSSYEKRPREKFWGIGDGPRVRTVPDMLIDPTVDDTAIKSTFGEDVLRNTVDMKVKYSDRVRSRVSGALMMRDIYPGIMEDIAMHYDTTKLVGFDEDGVKNVYVEHEFSYDSRGPTSEYATRTLDATGWYVSVHTGVARGIEGDPTKYYRYGGELQRYFDLYDGNRVLALRAMFDAVAGTDGRTDGRIAFTDLPRLGGTEYLRGYQTDRFRDKAVALATAEYQWVVGNNFSAYTFVDVGRPIESLEDAKETEVFRMGFGGGLQIHTRNTFLTRLQVAATREGDLQFNLIFSPAFGRRERAGKY